MRSMICVLLWVSGITMPSRETSGSIPEGVFCFLKIIGEKEPDALLLACSLGDIVRNVPESVLNIHEKVEKNLALC